MSIQHIKGKIRVVERDPVHSGLVIIEFPLNKMPDEVWEYCFLEDSPFRWVNVHKPKLISDCIRVKVADDEIRSTVEYVLKCIGEANECYKKQKEKRDIEEKKRREKEAQAKKRLDELTKGLSDL